MLITPIIHYLPNINIPLPLHHHLHASKLHPLPVFDPSSFLHSTLLAMYLAVAFVLDLQLSATAKRRYCCICRG